MFDHDAEEDYDDKDVVVAEVDAALLVGADGAGLDFG